MSIARYIAAGGAIGGGLVVGLVAWRALTTKDKHVLKDVVADSSGGPGKTKWRGVNAILDKLRALAEQTGIPLGLLVGWIGDESGGKLATKTQPGPGDTSLDERGYFQLTPDESRMLGIDHERLSTDVDYSLDAGIKLVRHYQSVVNDLMTGVTSAGTAFYWRMVKLAHSVGSGQIKKIVNMAKAAGQAGSWEELESFALDLSIKGPQPKKWFPFVDKVYAAGRPFGFGSEPAAVVGLSQQVLRHLDRDVMASHRAYPMQPGVVTRYGYVELYEQSDGQRLVRLPGTDWLTREQLRQVLVPNGGLDLLGCEEPSYSWVSCDGTRITANVPSSYFERKARGS